MRRTTILPVLAMVIVSALLAGDAWGRIRERTVQYTDGSAVMAGYLAYDDAIKVKRGGVLVFHEWWGLNDYARSRTRQLARMGYVAFAADVYGGGRRAKTRGEAARLAGLLKKDRKLMRRRARAALRFLKAHKLVDADRVAAIGFCFGGTAALELARSGADLQAAVSFHGGLDTPDPADAKRIKAEILVLHGADDPHVPPSQVAAFQKEMRSASVDWQMNTYGGAVHAFTNPAAGSDPSRGSAYNERAETRSWAAMELLFLQTIGLPYLEEEGAALGTVGEADRRERADRGRGDFARDRIARPIGRAGAATGRAVGAAGKATGRAFKRAFTWTWDKLRGKDKETPDDPRRRQETD